MLALNYRDPLWTTLDRLFSGNLHDDVFFNNITTAARRKLEEVATSYEFEVPGVAKENIKVSVENDYLLLEYTDRRGRTMKEGKYVGEVSNPTAVLKDGVLTVDVTRQDVKKKIEVKVE